METKLKFKVGDKVRVKPMEWYNSEKKGAEGCILKGYVFTKEMSYFCENILTIEDVYSDFYLVKETNYKWEDWMFEDDAVTEEKQEVEQLNKNDMETKEMTQEEVFEYLNNTKILCTSVEETSKLQKKLFELGIKWASDSNANADDVVNDAFLLFVEDNIILFDGDISYWVQDENKKIEPSEILSIKIKEEKPKFDPSTLQPFDKVLVRDNNSSKWVCSLFSQFESDSNFVYVCVSCRWKMCIPYNEETKHLLGTSDEAPEFYRLD